MKDLLLGLDFGGTKLSAALAEGSAAAAGGPWLDLRRLLTPATADARYEWDAMLALADRLLAGAGRRDRLAAIGVSFGGPVDFDRGIVRLSHHVAGWDAFPLRQKLAGSFGVPVFVDNDANVAALGEHRFGAGRGYEHLLYVTVSTGVGGGWILAGQPWRGAEGMAGELGHTVVRADGPLCLCGKRGCVERLASGPYMAAAAEALLASEPDRGSVLRGLRAGNNGHLDAQALARAAAAGDELARQVLLEGAWALGAGIGNAANLMNPECCIVGGGVSKSGVVWWQELRRVAKETALPEVGFAIVPAALGDDAPLRGAIALALAG